MARHWGEAGGRVPASALWLTTLNGKFAQTCGRGIFADYFYPLPSPKTWFLTRFVYLAAGQFIGWETALRCPATEAGVYRIEAGYEPNEPQTDAVARLPEANGLVLTKRVEASPVTIEIK